MTLKPPRRRYTDGPREGPKDVDAAGRAQRLHALAWAIAGGLPGGVGLGLLLGNLLAGLILGPVLVWGVTIAVAELAGRGAGTLYMPSGSSTPRKREFSRAEALTVRGEYQDAIAVYEAEIARDPGDGQPYLRIARLWRDELKDPAQAVVWFRKATREANLSTPEEMRARRELAEIFLYTLREPRKAAPELARLAEGYPRTEDGRWAAGELALIKEEMMKD